MDWQLVPVSVIVAAAAWYLGQKTWRSWSRRASGCGGGCGCAKESATAPRARSRTLIPVEQLRLRRQDTARH